MRRLLALCGVVGLLGAGLALASCGGSNESAVPTTETTTTETTTERSLPTPPGPTEIAIVVVNGLPEDGILRASVEKNDRVVVVVTSDVADTVHLHGYDVIREVAPGRPARLPFKATLPGRFEVELEERGVEIADISVTP